MNKQFFLQLENDSVVLRQWAELGEFAVHEPIVESPHFDTIIKLVMHGLETGENHGSEIWDLLLRGAREYFDQGENDGTEISLKEQIYQATRPL